MVQTTLIILTRNEIDGVKNLFKKIPFKKVDEYFAVDYKSSDGTVEYFLKNKIPVLKQKNPGRAEAFYLAFKKAKGKYLIFFSPDGNEDPADIPKLVKQLIKGADMAIASRFTKKSRNEEDDNILKFRAWANRGFTLLVNVIWKSKITDSINGYRAIRKTSFHKLKLDAKGYAVEFQMTIRALKLKMKIVEIPTREGKRVGGKSGSAAIPTGIKFIYYFLREIIKGNNFN
ncbi:hypothetical protein A3I80_02300 [Candidatus Gottesmanbacteria bacterium RIFCSPLOWO2_02_FULL_40_10]|nr:MAG: hypothetical protein A3I80_02300 [Candidatus Gottesmanbacteria bacterium RIFCSPLOWO2_02_FULL_40_10]